MMERISQTALHLRYKKETGKDAVYTWNDMERDIHWEYSVEYIRWMESQLGK